MARATPPDRGRSHLVLVYVRPRVRRNGVAKLLIRACVEEVKAKGATRVSLDVLTANATARTVWKRLGFEEVALVMESSLEELERRLVGAEIGTSRGAVHVQTDDDVSVDRLVGRFVPRLEAPSVAAAENGWIRIHDPVFDVDREAQSRFARELSERLGAVVVALGLEQGAVVRFRMYERGRLVDEYLSVPNHYGVLPKGDELALAVNPTLVARLTGADREVVRHVMRNAASPRELPPADELYDTIAQLLGLEP
jgi:Acetyltransferase (GNAT) family